MKVLIKQKRIILRMSQEALARKTNTGRSTISDIERGKHLPNVILAMKIAAALNCTVEDIFKL